MTNERIASALHTIIVPHLHEFTSAAYAGATTDVPFKHPARVPLWIAREGSVTTIVTRNVSVRFDAPGEPFGVPIPLLSSVPVRFVVPYELNNIHIVNGTGSTGTLVIWPENWPYADFALPFGPAPGR